MGHRMLRQTRERKTASKKEEAKHPRSFVTNLLREPRIPPRGIRLDTLNPWATGFAQLQVSNKHDPIARTPSPPRRSPEAHQHTLVSYHLATPRGTWGRPRTCIRCPKGPVGDNPPSHSARNSGHQLRRVPAPPEALTRAPHGRHTQTHLARWKIVKKVENGRGRFESQAVRPSQHETRLPSSVRSPPLPGPGDRSGRQTKHTGHQQTNPYA